MMWKAEWEFWTSAGPGLNAMGLPEEMRTGLLIGTAHRCLLGCPSRHHGFEPQGPRSAQTLLASAAVTRDNLVAEYGKTVPEDGDCGLGWKGWVYDRDNLYFDPDEGRSRSGERAFTAIYIWDKQITRAQKTWHPLPSTKTCRLATLFFYLKI